jgi:hypothetical protein
VVNVTDGPDVDVGLGPLELRLRHFCVLRLVGALVSSVDDFSCAAPKGLVTRQGYSDQMFTGPSPSR